MGKGRLLLVEEDHILADQVKDLLQSSGYEILHIATSLEDAIRSVCEKTPDLVITDDWFGHQVVGVEAALFDRVQSPVPILHLADYLEMPMLGRSHAAQLCGYIPKSIRNGDLCRAVERSLF